MSDGRIARGIPPGAIPGVITLLLNSFPLKVRDELRPRGGEQARRLVARGIVPARGWVALDAERKVEGVAGVGTRGRPFLRVGFATLAREFGTPGALSRWLHARIGVVLTRPRRRQWHVDVVAVRDASRGRGVGTALLAAILEAAGREGAESIALEVVDVNERALRLYERLGFRRVRTLRTGSLTARVGYRAVHFMRLDIPRPSC